MKSFKKIALLLMLVLGGKAASASVVEVTSGDLSLLKGAGVINIQYDYSKLTVGGYPTLDDWIAYKKKTYETRSGKSGDEWYKNWINSRDNVMVPRFEDVMNKKLAKSKLSVAQNTQSAKYTLVVKLTHYIEDNVGWPYFIGVMTMFEAKVYLVETQKPETILATIRADYLPEVGDLGGSIGNLIVKYTK